MAKLTALVLLLVALAAVASASAYTTVVTTTVTDETNPRGSSSSCEREMEQMMPMQQCMMWMKSKMRGPHNDAFLRSAVANPRFQEEHLQGCCSELQRFSSGCRCDAVKEMMMDMQQQQYGRMEQMEKMACSLPSMCGMKTECSCRRSSVIA